jgi:hypothetical protein
MKRNAFLMAAVLALASFGAGCFSMTSWSHNKRHLKQIWNEFQGLHEDIDRVIFGLERNPAE